jgi:hypothetical protein
MNLIVFAVTVSAARQTSYAVSKVRVTKHVILLRSTINAALTAALNTGRFVQMALANSLNCLANLERWTLFYS